MEYLNYTVAPSENIDKAIVYKTHAVLYKKNKTKKKKSLTKTKNNNIAEPYACKKHGGRRRGGIRVDIFSKSENYILQNENEELVATCAAAAAVVAWRNR